MEWSHTHFDGYELLAVPSDSPASIVILDSSALVLVQRVLLPEGDAPPRALTWQPGGASTGCSSGALSCIVSTRGRGPELAVFTPNGVYLSSRVRYSWSCTARVPLSPLHKGSCDRILLSWSCRGPLVVADQAISVWSNNSAVPSANANTFSSDESGSSGGTSDDDSSGGGETPSYNRTASSSAFGPRSVYRNSLRLSRKWVHKGGVSGHTSSRPPRPPNFVALATSPCGCMFAAACKGSEDVTVWLRRRNMPAQGKPWEAYGGGGGGSGDGSVTFSVSGAGRERGGNNEEDQLSEGPWNFQPATVLKSNGPLVQVVWGRGPGAQQDYLLTLGEDGSAHIWVEQQWDDRFSMPTESGTVKFVKTATIKSWYGDNLRLKSVGFVKWAYFGSHSRDLVGDKGSASGSAYHLLHQQEQAADGGGRPYRSDNWIIGCGDDGRRFLWSVKDMPLPDGRTIPEPVEVASLPFSWLGGLSGGAAAAAAAAAASQSSAAPPQISAVGYYDAQGADGAPAEVQVVARAAGGTVAVITARVHRANASSRYVLRNTRSVVLPLGQAAAATTPLGRLPTGNGQRINGVSPQKSRKRVKTRPPEGVSHPNLPLLARLERSESDDGGEGGWAVEVHSWVNGGSHLQCIPCKPQGSGKGKLGHTAGAEPGGTDEDGTRGGISVDLVFDDSSDSDAKGKDRVAPVFGKLAEKVRSGDELSFIPYALPSLTLACRSRHEKNTGGGGGGGGGGASPSVDAVCYCGAGAACSGQGQGHIKHAMWMSDWIGAEALPPALAVIDDKSRLHVFELDDGASSNEPPFAADGGSGGTCGGVFSTESGDKFNPNGLLGKRVSAKSPTGSVASLSNKSSHLCMKELMEQDTKENERSSSPERMSRRARAEFGGPSSFKEDRPPVEKTVVLPLDSKYGLGLTLAFEGNRVEVSTFVKHPDTSEMLPAEASGRIRSGDQLVDINGHGVEGLNAEEATSLIRQARRESMEGGAVSLELTFREVTPAPGATPVRPGSRSGSPGPRTGWYTRKSKLRGSGRGSAKGSTAAGWASTDADQHALRWNPIGSDEMPAFKTCTLLPWLGSVALAGANGAGPGAAGTPNGASTLPIGDGGWAEIGVYPPGDYRKRREALLLGFQPSQASSSSGDGKGYVVALLVEAAPQGGISVAEVCRAPLGAGQQPVSFNREKTPPGAPTNGRATAEAVCEDGWVRRWCVARDLPSGDKQETTFALSKIDICEPFQRSGGDEPGSSTAVSMSPATLIAVASPTLLAVARSIEAWPRRVLKPARSFQDGDEPGAPAKSVAAAEAAAAAAPAKPPVLEVWSCAKTPYPRCPFKKDGTVVLPRFRPGQVVEGMCWVSPEAGDERGAAVSGHCLCVSVGGSVTVLTRERLQQDHAPVSPGLEVTAGGGGGCTWSPVFRVANPSSLLTCRTAGLRDFCQGLMAKYQRNLALSLVRTRAMKRFPTTAAAMETLAEGTAEGASAAANASTHSLTPPLPLPLLRDEIAGLRGTTQEGKRLEDWHPESLVALWCTSLMVGREGREGPGWEMGRERTLSVLRWVSEDAEPESGGVVAGTVVPFLAHGSDDASKAVGGDLGKLKACFASYLRHRLEDEEAPGRGQEGVSSTGSYTSAPSVRRLPHASTRHLAKSPTSREDTPASARHIADTAAAAGVPRRLLNLSGAELSALSALLDVALGHDVNTPTASSAPSVRSTGAAAGDTAAALFSKAPPPPPSPSSSSSLPKFRSGENMPTAVIATTNHMDDYANVFFLARGLRTRLGKNGAGSKCSGNKDVELGIASSAALAMLLAPDGTQREVLETLCPKSGGGVVAPGTGLTWGDASAMLLPLWVRDALELQRVTEAVASTTFLQDRDLMAAAMFFAALGKEKKLLALAKADRGFVGQRNISGGEGDINSASGQSQGATQGQRLEKLLAHDFSSPRGRSVAEKNAYILLRKRKFKSAAAVFLLPRPAMLKEALQVILMHVNDIQLALVIARLVEIRDGGGASPPARAAGSLGGMGGYGGGGGGFGARGRGSFGGGFSSGLGDGGGGGADDDVAGVNAAAAHKSIGGASRKLLRDEFLPMFDGESDMPKTLNGHGPVQRQRSFAAIRSPRATPLQRDPFLECAMLFWLGQSDRALRALCRGPAAEHNAYNAATSGTSAPKGASTVVMDGVSGLDLCNRAIDVATRPFLVSKLQQRESSSKPRRERAGWPATAAGGGSSSNGGGGGGSNGVSANFGHTLVNAQRAAAVRLTTVEYLARNGMEISALEVLGSNAGGDWAAELATQQLADVARLDHHIKVAAGTVTGGGGVDPAGGDLSGGVFSGFQGPASGLLTKPKAVASASAAATSGELSGDMFGAFGGPPQRTAAKPAAAAAAAAASGELSGDMFGGFDGPPRTRPTLPAASTASSTASGELAGDMFGAFDAAPPHRKTEQAAAAVNASAAASGELSGDMFGAFDAAPPQRKTKQTPAAVNASAAASGELSGDMFGAFDAAPPQKAKQTPAAVNAAAAASGELSGDMFGAFDAAPPQRKTTTGAAAAVPSGELSGDLFGGFDGPNKSPAAPAKTPTTPAKPRLSSPTAVATGELSSDLFASFDGPPPRVRPEEEAVSSSGSEVWTSGSSRHGVGNPAGSSLGGEVSRTSPRASSYGYIEGEEPSWEGYDRHVAGQNGEDGDGDDDDDGVDSDPKTEKQGKEDAGAPLKAPNSDAVEVPQRWDVWAEDLAYEAATKRLLRELRHLLGGLDALAPTAPNMAFALESLGAATATASPGASPVGAKLALLESIRAAAEGLCEAHGLSARALTAAAAGALSHASAGGSRRLGALCLLLNALDRPVAVDAVVCAAAGRLVQCCSAHGQAHLEDLSLGAAHARALGTEAEAAKEEARAKALSEAESESADGGGGDGGGVNTIRPESKRPAGSFVTAAATAAAATTERKAEAAKAAEAEAAEAAGGLGLENLRPHLSELRATAFQLELCLTLHARGCLRLSSRARAEAAVGFRAGLLVEALGRRYDVTAALVACPPSSTEVDGRRLSDPQQTEEGFPHGGDGKGGDDEARAWPDTPNANLLDALSRLPRPEFETKGLEPWESSLSGRPTLPKKAKGKPLGISDTSDAPTEETSRNTPKSEMAAAAVVAGESKTEESLEDPIEERLHLVRLTDSLSRGMWPTYARLACALNLLALRAMHAQLCGSLATLIWREDYRARAPLAARVCGAVPFHPAGEGGVALGSELKAGEYGGLGGSGGGGGGGKGGGGEVASPSSSTFYSAFLHPLYVWAQCLDRQFYAQAHRPRISPAHHLLPRCRGRPISPTALTERAAAGTATPALVSSSWAAAPSGGSGSIWRQEQERQRQRQPSDGTRKGGGPAKGDNPKQGRYESTVVSPGASRRECCPYLFQRGMVVSEEGVRGGQDHLRSDQTWPEEDSEERIAYQMLNGMRMADGSALASVPLHAVREGVRTDYHFVEAFYASDARKWLMRSGVNPAGPSAGTRIRKWENMGIVQRVRKAEWAGAQIHFRGDRHNGDTLLRFVDRWDVEHCGESAGAALRAGPLGRVSYQLVPAGRTAAGRETLYGKLLHAIGGEAASELWTRLGAEDWLVRTVARAEFPFSYRHQRAELPSPRGSDAAAGPPVAVVGAAPQTPAAAAAAAADLPCSLHDGNRPERDAFCLCVFEHLCRNALFRRLRLPHRFQALVTVQLLGLKNLSPHYHPSKTDVFAAVSLKRLDPAADGNNSGRSNGHTGGETAAKRRGRNTSVTAIKRLLPTANGQASQQSRWGAKAAFRFPLPEEASPYVLAYGDGAYELVMGGHDNNDAGGGGGAGKGMGSQGPPRCVRIAVWRKQFLADQRLGEVDVPLGKLDDREDIDEWVGLRGDKGSSWFVNVRFSLRFVMVSVSDPIPDDDSEDIVDVVEEEPDITLSFALADVDIM